MATQDLPPWRHSNRYSADSACEKCAGILRHESWCNSENADYAYRAALQPSRLSLADHLHLHALGVAWREETL